MRRFHLPLDPRFLLLLTIACALIAGCRTSERFDDAVRIRAEREGAYRRAPDGITMRDGRTLRGMVIEVQIAPRPSAPGKIDTTLLFLDAALADKPRNYERIPIDDVERIAALFGLPRDTIYNNVNVVESYGTTEQIPTLRRVPVRNYVPYLAASSASGANPAPSDCGCLPLDVSLPFPELECPQRRYGWYFAELRGVYSAYNDKPTRTREQGREAYLGEIATGIRFGGDNEWGAGLAFSAGLSSYDSYNSEEILRPIALLHLRYQAPGPVTNLLGICMKPFAYGQFGASIDRASINLMKFNFSSSESCGECGDIIRELEASGELGDVDLSIPVTVGLGVGIDIPVASFVDISADIGWRSLGLGENADIGGWVIPSMRRVNMFYLRAGLTF